MCDEHVGPHIPKAATAMDYDYAIIGAGISGAAAAYELADTDRSC